MDRLAAEKAALRRSILARRDAIPAASRAELSARITTHILALPGFSSASAVLAYLSFGSEYDTTRLVRATLAQGKRLILPRVDRANRRLGLFQVVDPETQTVAGTWGIREPVPERCTPVVREAAALVLVPGVAFTLHGARLGYGGGFYDRLLAHWRERPPLIAPAFGLQVIEHLPTSPADVTIDAVVTEDGLRTVEPET